MAVSIVMTGTGRNCSITSGSNSMVVSSATGLVVGATIQGTGIPTGARIQTISGTTVTMAFDTGAVANATATNATASLIFSSVYGSILTISMSASGDTANMDSIYNAGFGIKQRGLATREILFPGGLGVEWKNIVAGAVFDFQNWTIECGSTGYWAWEQSTILGELRGGYLVNGTQFIKCAGPTFISNNFKNSAAGGSNMFTGTATGTVTGNFRMNNLRVIYQVGSNTAPYFACGRMNCIVDNMILDYQGGGGPNAGISAAFGYLKNTTIVKANSGIGNPNLGNYATIDGLNYSGIFTDSPNHKFAIPNGYVLEGYAPQVLSSQTLGAFQGGTTETYANIDLSTAGWGLDDLKAKYFRYGGPNTINFPRRVTLEFNDSTGANLADVTLYIKSGSTSVINAVQAGDYDANTQALVLTWTTTTNAYRIRDSFTDTIAQVAQVRKYGYVEQSTSYSLNLAKYSQPFFMLHEVAVASTDPADAIAVTAVTLDWPNKILKWDGTATTREALRRARYELALTTNSDKPNFIDVEGSTLKVYGGWKIEVGAAGVVNGVTDINQIEVVSQTLSIASGGAVNVPYRDQDGLRVTVTNLDPQAFGITWYLRYKLTSATEWTLTSGTGNTALILLDSGSYNVQVRAPGYDWKASTLNTNNSLSLDMNLSYQTSSTGTPQYTEVYDAALEAIFSFDLTQEAVKVTNTTGTILYPGFNEAYQATQRIQHLADLVWTWENPIKANSVAQRIIIPVGNPISFFLSTDSDASVKFTNPVIHEDTGLSADDRVKGNPSGFQIILGSPATAESAGLANTIISSLGGGNYEQAEASQMVIRALVDEVKALVGQVKARTDLVPDAPATSAEVTALGTPLQADDYVAPANSDIAAIKAKTDTLVNTDLSAVATQASVDALGSPLQADDYVAPANSDIAAIKTTVEAIEPTDLSGIPGAVRTELATELGRIDVAVSTRSTLTAEDIPEGLTAAEVWSATTRTLTQSAGLTPEQEATLNAIPTLAEIENSSALAKEATTSAIRAKTDNLPANPAAVGSQMTLTSAYDAAKTAASQASVDAKPTLAQIEASAVLAKEDSVQDVGDLVAGQ